MRPGQVPQHRFVDMGRLIVRVPQAPDDRGHVQGRGVEGWKVSPWRRRATTAVNCCCGAGDFRPGGHCPSPRVTPERECRLHIRSVPRL